jgi:hypothetical protein
LKNCLDEILNYRSAGPLSVPATGTKKLNFTGTRTKRKILAEPEPGPKTNYQDRDRDLDRDRDQKKLVPHISSFDKCDVDGIKPRFFSTRSLKLLPFIFDDGLPYSFIEALKLHVMIVVSIAYGSNSSNIRVSFNAAAYVIEIEIIIDFLPLQLDIRARTGFYIQHEYNVELDFQLYFVRFHSVHDRMPWVLQ